MNIRDYKKAEPLLKKFESLCKEIGALKANAKFLAEHGDSISFRLPKLKKVAEKKVEIDEYSSNYLESELKKIMYGGWLISDSGKEKEKQEFVDMTLDASSAIRLHTFLIAEKVEERKKCAEQLKEIGLHYKINS